MSLLIVGVASASAGCAFGTRHVTLRYTPVVPPASAQQMTALYVAPFQDKRPKPQVVGHVLNGFGMKTAKVVADNDVQAWIRDALIAELRRAGYTVVNDPAHSVKVGGDIIEIDCKSYFNYEGSVFLAIRLKRDQTVLLEQTYAGEDTSGLNWAATAKSYGKVLEAALQAAMPRIVHDITRALQQEST